MYSTSCLGLLVVGPAAAFNVAPAGPPGARLRGVVLSAERSAAEQVEPDLSLAVGVAPSKTMAADYGFDPLNLAAYDYFIGASKVERDPEAIVLDYRDAELRHGRLAMLAALAWPVQELAAGSLARAVGGANLLADGRSPSVLNGGLFQGPVLATVLATAAAAAVLDLKASEIRRDKGADWQPGDFGFDPLRLARGMSPVQLRDMQAKEINNGRLAMLAVAAYVAQEAWTGEPIVALSEQLFTPVIYYPWFKQVMTDAFGAAAFK